MMPPLGAPQAERQGWVQIGEGDLQELLPALRPQGEPEALHPLHPPQAQACQAPASCGAELRWKQPACCRGLRWQVHPRSPRVPGLQLRDALLIALLQDTCHCQTQLNLLLAILLARGLAPSNLVHSPVCPPAHPPAPGRESGLLSPFPRSRGANQACPPPSPRSRGANQACPPQSSASPEQQENARLLTLGGTAHSECTSARSCRRSREEATREQRRATPGMSNRGSEGLTGSKRRECSSLDH